MMGTVDAAEAPTEKGLDEGWRPRQLVFELSRTVTISAIYVKTKETRLHVERREGLRL